MQRVYIVGAGGLGRELHQYAILALTDGPVEIVGFLDDGEPTPVEAGLTSALPIVGAIRSHEPQQDARYLMAIGDPSIREEVTRALSARGAIFLTLVHPLAYVAPNSEVGEGCVVAPFATVGAGAILKPFTHLHFYSSAAHDSVIGPFASLSPYAVANGQARVGKGAFLGTRATVNPLRRVGAYAKVTAGSVVYRDVPERAIADGNPAKSRPLLQFADPVKVNLVPDEDEKDAG